MTALPNDFDPDEIERQIDKELDRLDIIDRHRDHSKHMNLEHRIRQEFKKDGATYIMTTRSDRCLIIGHTWVPERLLTRRCSFCWLWESV